MTYRSNRLRLFVMVAALGLVALSFVFWVATAANLKAEFTLSQAVTLLLILGLFVFALLVVGNGVVRADADGLYFRNGLSRHRYAWARIPPGRHATRRRLGPGAHHPDRPAGGGRSRPRPPDADGDPEERRALCHRGRRRSQPTSEGVSRARGGPDRPTPRHPGSRRVS